MTNDELKMLAAVEQKSKSNKYRLDKVEARQDNLEALITSVATLATEQEHMKKDVTEIKYDVKCLTERSGKRWDELVDKIIWAIIAAVIGFLISQLGFS